MGKRNELAEFFKMYYSRDKRSRFQSFLSKVQGFMVNPVSSVEVLGIMTREKGVLSRIAGFTPKIFHTTIEDRVLRFAPEFSAKNKQKLLDKIVDFSIVSGLSIQILLKQHIWIPDTVIILTILYILTDEILDDAKNTSVLNIFTNEMAKLVKGERFDKREFLQQISKHDASRFLRTIRQGNPKFFPLASRTQADRIVPLADTLEQIARVIGIFLDLIKNDPNREDILEYVQELNDLQNRSALTQNIMYQVQQLPINGHYTLPSFDTLINIAHDKGAVTFKLYGLLLSPNISPFEIDMLDEIGKLFQDTDDLEDIPDDARDFNVTPPIQRLLNSVDWKSFAHNPHMSGDLLEEYKAKLKNLADSFSERELIQNQNLEDFYTYVLETAQNVQRIFGRFKSSHYSGKLQLIQFKTLERIEEAMMEKIHNSFIFLEQKIVIPECRIISVSRKP